jgi:hypothetical protein
LEGSSSKIVDNRAHLVKEEFPEEEVGNGALRCVKTNIIDLR